MEQIVSDEMNVEGSIDVKVRCFASECVVAVLLQPEHFQAFSQGVLLPLRIQTPG
jgi:hypothetical protein